MRYSNGRLTTPSNVESIRRASCWAVANTKPKDDFFLSACDANSKYPSPWKPTTVNGCKMQKNHIETESITKIIMEHIFDVKS